MAAIALESRLERGWNLRIRCLILNRSVSQGRHRRASAGRVAKGRAARVRPGAASSGQAS